MNKQTTIIGVVVLIVVVIGAFVLFRQDDTATQTTTAPTNQTTTTDEFATTPTGTDSGTTQTGESPNQVVFDGQFSPSELTVQVGDTVTFVNNTTQPIWPASAVHPTHARYPTTGGCLGSTFDACQPVEQGQSWSFTFEVAGEWGYHDHLNPSQTGMIVVVE